MFFLVYYILLLLTTWMFQILDRENKRERILEARMRELRLKMRQDHGGPQVTESDPTAGDKDLIEATTEYEQTVKELQAQQPKTPST